MLENFKTMEENILKITEGTTERVTQFKMPLNLVYNKKYVLMNKNVFFEHC
jgi:hypothetical protein